MINPGDREDDNPLARDCDHDWKDSYCLICDAECGCVAGNGTFEHGQCMRCGVQCEHNDTDGCECLDCGCDITEYLTCRAEDIFEGER